MAAGGLHFKELRFWSGHGGRCATHAEAKCASRHAGEDPAPGDAPADGFRENIKALCVHALPFVRLPATVQPAQAPALSPQNWLDDWKLPSQYMGFAAFV